MKYRDIFQRKNSLIVVIHADSEQQVLRNVKIADEEGANGVFLINHTMSFYDLIDIYDKTRINYPDFWIGLNLLDLYPSAAVEFMPPDVSGLWVDSVFSVADMHAKDDVAKAQINWRARQRRADWNGLYFGGVAFKYQEAVEDYGLAAKQSIPYLDVVTTSGAATGHPPKIEKIKEMREAIGNFPLAIASGMNPINVVEYRDLVDCFLVATGISRSVFELEPILVKKFVKAIE